MKQKVADKRVSELLNEIREERKIERQNYHKRLRARKRHKEKFAIQSVCPTGVRCFVCVHPPTPKHRFLCYVNSA